MIDNVKIIRGISFDPYLNLAIEQQLMETIPRGCCTLSKAGLMILSTLVNSSSL